MTQLNDEDGKWILCMQYVFKWIIRLSDDFLNAVTFKNYFKIRKISDFVAKFRKLNKKRLNL